MIDDIWSAETWHDIRTWLPHENENNGRVIVTTRFQAVGAACSDAATDYLHPVGFLSDVDSEKLFNHSFCEPQTNAARNNMPMKKYGSTVVGCLWP